MISDTTLCLPAATGNLLRQWKPNYIVWFAGLARYKLVSACSIKPQSPSDAPQSRAERERILYHDNPSRISDELQV
jgi:hypothetical protein